MSNRELEIILFSDAHLVTDEIQAWKDLPGWFRAAQTVLRGLLTPYMARQHALRRARLEEAAALAHGRETFFLGDAISDGTEGSLRYVREKFPHAEFIMGGHDIGQQDATERSPEERLRLMERAVMYLGQPCRLVRKKNIPFLLLCSELYIRHDPALAHFRHQQHRILCDTLAQEKRLVLMLHDPRAIFKISAILHRHWRNILAIFHGHLHYGYSWRGMKIFSVPSLSGHLWDMYTCTIFRPGYAVARIGESGVRVVRRRLPALCF